MFLPKRNLDSARCGSSLSVFIKILLHHITLLIMKVNLLPKQLVSGIHYPRTWIMYTVHTVPYVVQPTFLRTAIDDDKLATPFDYQA